MKTCSQCHLPHEGLYRYCRPCHAAYMRTYRYSHPLSPEQRFRSNARSYAYVYLKRGKLTREPCCQRCGDPNNQMHHPDYNKPLFVLWFCRAHHLELHQKRKTQSIPADSLKSEVTTVGGDGVLH